MKKISLIAGALSALAAFNASAGSDSFLTDASKKFQIKGQTSFGSRCLEASGSGGVWHPLLHPCSDSASGQKWNYTEHGQIITDVGSNYLCLTGRPSNTPVLQHCDTSNPAQSWNTVRRTLNFGLAGKTTYVYLQNSHGDLGANGISPNQSSTASYLRLENPADFDINIVPIYAQFSLAISYSGKPMNIFNSQDVGVGSRPTLTNYYNLHNNALFTARNDIISQSALCYTSPLPNSSWNWATYESCTLKGTPHNKYRWQFRASYPSKNMRIMHDILGNDVYNNNRGTANGDYIFVGTSRERPGKFESQYYPTSRDTRSANVDDYADKILPNRGGFYDSPEQAQAASHAAIARISSCSVNN